MCMLDEIRARRDEIYVLAKRHKAEKLRRAASAELPPVLQGVSDRGGDSIRTAYQIDMDASSGDHARA